MNLFKLAAALLRARTGRRKVLTERRTFPTDTYILEGLVAFMGGSHDLVRAESAHIVGSIDDETALILLTHVNFRTGAMHDMAAIAARALYTRYVDVWDAVDALVRIMASGSWTAHRSAVPDPVT